MHGCGFVYETCLRARARVCCVRVGCNVSVRVRVRALCVCIVCMCARVCTLYVCARAVGMVTTDAFPESYVGNTNNNPTNHAVSLPET